MAYNYASAFNDATTVDPEVIRQICLTALLNYREEFTDAGHINIDFVLAGGYVLATSDRGLPRKYTFEELGFKV